MSREQAVTALAFVIQAILECVQECGEHGVPAGLLYTATMSVISLEAFEQIMAGLVDAGKVYKIGHVYYAVR